jgi:hypothetical protein
MKTCLKSLLGLLTLLGVGAAAHAQYPGARPTVTPWLNLYRGGSTANLNYQNLVRPDMDFRSSIQTLQQQSRLNQQGITDLQSAPNTPLFTGHQSGFMTQGIYFQTIGAGGGIVGAQGAVPTFGTTNRPATNPAAGNRYTPASTYPR